MREKRRKKTRDPTTLEDGTDFINDENQDQMNFMNAPSMLSDEEYIDEDQVVSFMMTSVLYEKTPWKNKYIYKVECKSRSAQWSRPAKPSMAYEY